MSVPGRESAPLVLRGIDGGELPAFLAALGILRLLHSAESTPGPRLSWSWQGAWIPTLVGVFQPESAAERIVAGLRRDAATLRALGGDDELFLQSNFESTVSSIKSPFRSDSDGHRAASWLAALGSEACPKAGKSPPNVEHTPLKALGGGKQRFIPALIALMEGAEVSHVNRSLFHPWTYRDNAPSLRWHPRDDRRHAYRWQAPMLDPPTSETGGSALAAAALPLFPSVPTTRGLRTAAFSRQAGHRVTWPIWSLPMDLPTISALVGLGELQDDVPDRQCLSRLGVVEIYRCERIVVDKYVNFTPAWSP